MRLLHIHNNWTVLLLVQGRVCVCVCVLGWGGCNIQSMARKDVRERENSTRRPANPNFIPWCVFLQAFTPLYFCCPPWLFRSPPPFFPPPLLLSSPWLPVRTVVVFLPRALRWERADWLTPGAIRSNPQLLATKLTFPAFFLRFFPQSAPSQTNKQTVFLPTLWPKAPGRHSFCAIVTFCCRCSFSVGIFRSTVTNEGRKTKRFFPINRFTILHGILKINSTVCLGLGLLFGELNKEMMWQIFETDGGIGRLYLHFFNSAINWCKCVVNASATRELLNLKDRQVKFHTKDHCYPALLVHSYWNDY